MRSNYAANLSLVALPVATVLCIVCATEVSGAGAFGALGASGAAGASGAPGAVEAPQRVNAVARAADEPIAVSDEPGWTAPQALRRVRTGGIAAPLPEGIVLVRAVGELRPGALTRSWTFQPEEPGDAPRRTIAVLPSSALEDAAARLDAMGDAPRLRVELTGVIQLYRGQNFILPQMVTSLDATRSGRPASRVPDADALDADEIERRLRERLGPVPRGTDVPLGYDEGFAQGVREGRVIRRRGVVRRDDETGGWRFVPESEHVGSPDITMGLLPNRMLERIERFARVGDTPRPLLISGEVVRYGDRLFMLATAIEWPRTGRSLRPGGVASGSASTAR